MANIADLQVSLNLDTSKFKTDVAAATNDVKELKAALTGLKSRTFKIDLSTNLKSQIAGFKSAKTEIKNLQNHLSGLQSSIKATTGRRTLNLQINSNAEKVYNDVKSLNDNSKLLKATLMDARSGIVSYNNSLQLMNGSVKGVSTSIQTLCSDVRRLNLLLTKSNVQLRQLGTKTIRVKADTNIPKVLDTANQSVYKMTGTFSNLEGTMKRTFTGVGSSVAEAEANMKSMANATGNLKQVSSKLQSSFKDANGKIVKTMTEANSATKKVTESTKKLSSALANVKSVAQGIVIAQTFYNAVNAIQDVVGSMWDMHKSVETNAMAFEQLTGSVELSKDMIEYLQKYAASTVFTFEQASQSAKTLLAYGFKLENLSYVMKTIGDATSAFGKPENFDRISLAMGQMLAKGTAKAEELRQLMEANVPVVEILSEKLGMTAEEVVNIGDHAVSSTKVVNALLEGLNERYGDMSSNMALTTTGLINNIRESVAYIGSQLFKPLYDGFSGILKPISEKLNELSTVIRNAGVDGAIKYLFPPDMYNSIKVFCGLLAQLGQAIFGVLKAIQPVGRELIYTFINTFNIAAPVIIMFLNILAKLISVLTANRAVLQAFISVFMGFVIVNTVTRMVRDFTIGLGVLANITTFATKAVALLRSAMLLLAANPVVAAITLISGALIALIMSSERGRAAVDRLWVSLARLMGIKNVEIYKPLDPGDLEDDLDNFFDKLDSNITGVEGGMEDVGDEAGNAGKKVKDKFVASFDELFQVPEQLDEVSDSLGNISGGNLGDLDVGGLDDLTKNPIDTDAFDIGPIRIPIDLYWGKIPKPPKIDPPTPPKLPATEIWKPFDIELPDDYPIKVQAIELPVTKKWKPFEVELPNNFPIEVKPIELPQTKTWKPLKVELPNEYPVEVEPIELPVTKPWKPYEVEIPDELPLKKSFTASLIDLDSFRINFKNNVGKFVSENVVEFEKFAQSKQLELAKNDANILADAIGFQLEYQKVAGMENTTVLNSISTFKDNMVTAFKQGDDSILGNSQTFSSNFNSNVNSMIDNVVPLFKKVDEAKITGLTGSDSNVISLTSRFTSDVTSTFDDLLSNVIPLFEEFDSSQVKGLTGNQPTILTNLKTFGSNALSSIGEFVGNSISKFDDYARQVVSKFESTSLDTQKIKSGMYNALEVIDAAGMAAEIVDQNTHNAKLQAIANKHGLDINDIHSYYWEESNKLSELGLQEEYNNLDLSTKDKLKLLGQYYTNDLSRQLNHYSSLINNAKTKCNELKTTIVNKYNEIKTGISQKLNEITSNINSTWEKVKSNTRTAWNNVKSFIETPLKAVKTTVTNIMDWFSQKFEWLTNKINTMKNTASNFLSSLNPFGRSIEGPQISLTGDMSGVTMSNPLSPLTSMSNLYNGGLMTRDNLVGNTRSRTINVIEELGTITRNTNDTKSTSSNGGFINNPNMSNSVDDRPILYVGTLIADDRSLKELERKMEVIRTKEKNRRG